jgi:hypothetical protein
MCSNSVKQARLQEARLVMQACGSLDVVGICVSENRFAQIRANLDMQAGMEWEDDDVC